MRHLNQLIIKFLSSSNKVCLFLYYININTHFIVEVVFNHKKNVLKGKDIYSSFLQYKVFWFYHYSSSLTQPSSIPVMKLFLQTRDASLVINNIFF